MVIGQQDIYNAQSATTSADIRGLGASIQTIVRDVAQRWMVKIMDEYTAMEQAYKNGYDAGYADAKEESKHGKWERVKGFVGFFTWEVQCSLCGEPQDKKSNYCPNCGHPMEVRK